MPNLISDFVKTANVEMNWIPDEVGNWTEVECNAILYNDTVNSTMLLDPFSKETRGSLGPVAFENMSYSTMLDRYVLKKEDSDSVFVGGSSNDYLEVGTFNFENVKPHNGFTSSFIMQATESDIYAEYIILMAYHDDGKVDWYAAGVEPEMDREWYFHELSYDDDTGINWWGADTGRAFVPRLAGRSSDGHFIVAEMIVDFANFILTTNTASKLDLSETAQGFPKTAVGASFSYSEKRVNMRVVHRNVATGGLSVVIYKYNAAGVVVVGDGKEDSSLAGIFTDATGCLPNGSKSLAPKPLPTTTTTTTTTEETAEAEETTKSAVKKCCGCRYRRLRGGNVEDSSTGSTD